MLRLLSSARGNSMSALLSGRAATLLSHQRRHYQVSGEDTSYKGTTVEGYGPGYLEVNGVQNYCGVVAFPNTYVLWKPRTIQEITIESLALIPVYNPPIEVLFLGVGKKNQLVPPEIHQYLLDRGIGLEVMDTVNAGATFNLLSAEGRLVAAALLLPDPNEDTDS